MSQKRLAKEVPLEAPTWNLPDLTGVEPTKKPNNTHSAILGTVSREHRVPLVSAFSKREGFYENYSPKIHKCPLKFWSFQKERIVFPALFFRGHACFGGESYIWKPRGGFSSSNVTWLVLRHSEV